MNKKVVIILICLFSVALSLLIKQEVLENLLEKLIFNAVSILVGLSIAVVGIFLGSINSLYLSIYRIAKTENNIPFTDDEIEEIKNGLSELVDELKDNALFTIYTFLIIIIIFFLKEVDLPYIQWFIDSEIFTKQFVLNALILIGNFLIFYAIIDSTYVIFKITKAFELTKI